MAVSAADSLSAVEESLLIMLGKNNLVKYPSVIDNVRHFDICSLADDDCLQALHVLLDYSEEVSNVRKGLIYLIVRLDAFQVPCDIEWGG